MLVDAAYRPQIAKNLSAIRNKTCLKREPLHRLADVAEATIFRIEQTSNKFKFDSLQKIVDVFGITIDELKALDIDAYSEAELQKRVEKYRKAFRNDEISASELKAYYKDYKGTTYYLQVLINEGFFDEYRTIQEIRERIFHHSHIDYKPAILTNTIKQKEYFSGKLVQPNLKKYKLKEGWEKKIKAQ